MSFLSPDNIYIALGINLSNKDTIFMAGTESSNIEVNLLSWLKLLKRSHSVLTSFVQAIYLQELDDGALPVRASI